MSVCGCYSLLGIEDFYRAHTWQSYLTMMTTLVYIDSNALDGDKITKQTNARTICQFVSNHHRRLGVFA